MNKVIEISTRNHTQMIDITEQVKDAIAGFGLRDGVCIVFTPHATGAITINENADPNVSVDILNVLDRLVPEHGNYLHDRIDGNAASHIKSSILGSSQSIPIVHFNLALGTWQNIFFCEFDGPRSKRRVIVSAYSN